MTRPTTEERPVREPGTGEMAFVGSVTTFIALMLFFAAGPEPKLLLSIGVYVSFVVLSLLVTWFLDRRYPA